MSCLLTCLAVLSGVVSSRRLIVAVAVLLLIVPGCKKGTTLPESDGTAPSIGMDALVAGVAHTAGSPGSTVTARAFHADTLDLVAHGEDNEGVRATRIQGTVQVECRPAISASSATVHIADDSTDTSNPKPGSPVRSDRYAQYSFDETMRNQVVERCGSGRFVRAAGEVTASAENYYGGSSRTGAIKLVWTQGVPTLKVATLNLASGYWPLHGGYPANYLDGLAKLLEDADIAALQEVDVGTRRVNGVDQPAYLAEHSGLTYHAFGHDAYFDGGEVGVGILSRYPIVKVVTHPTPGGRQLYLEAQVNVDGERHTVFSTHWDFGSRAIPAKDQFLALQADAQPPVVLGGDFNAGPGDMPFDLLHDGLKPAQMFEIEDIAKHIETHPDGSECGHGLDHIFVQGPYDVTNVDACIPSSDVTDHAFLLATLERND
jgi:endonuclease/exonuclease/phosphatase family metal-dependent hydrolase